MWFSLRVSLCGFFCLFVCFEWERGWLCCPACRILVPQLGDEPGPPVVEEQSPNHWTAREFPVTSFLIKLS